jgi:hypothetical protein
MCEDCYWVSVSDFALQRLKECSALETERVRLAALRWHAGGSDVRLDLPVGLQKKKTPKFAVHAGGSAENSGEKRNVLIVRVLLPIAIDLALRSNMHM